MSRTEIKKRVQKSELARVVAFARVEGENEVETAVRLLGELGRLRKLESKRRPKRKGIPETDVAAVFDDQELFEIIRGRDGLGKMLRKGDPDKVLVGGLDEEVEEGRDRRLEAEPA